MRRRRVLAATAAAIAGLAGCSSRDRTPTLTPPDVPGDDQTPTDEPTPTPHDDDGLSLGAASVVDLETGPRTAALSPVGYGGADGASVTVELVGTATDESPARARATLQNDNDWPNTFRLTDLPPFQPVTRAEADVSPDERATGLYLAPTAEHNLVGAETPHRRNEEGYWVAEADPPELPETVRLQAGETVEGEYLLLGAPDRAGFPTGRYRFGGPDQGVTIAVWHTRRPGPTAASRFASRSVPDCAEGGTAWYHEADAATPVFLRPSTERLTAPGRIGFTLVNHSRDPLGGNPYDWSLYKLADGDWFHLAPWAIPVPYSEIHPGRTHEYTLRAFHGETVPCDEGQTVGHLGGGTYAFEVGFSRGESAGGPTPAAMFELDAPPVEPTPDADLTLERDGETVRVTTPEWGDEEHPPDRRFAVTPTNEGGRRVLPEQLFRRPFGALRNVLPFFDEGVERVVLRTDDHALWHTDGQTARRRVTYEGQSYEIRPMEEGQ